MPRNTDRLEGRPPLEIKTLADLDELMLGLCQLDAQIKRAEAEAEVKALALKDSLAKALAPLQERRAALEAAGLAFVRANEALVTSGKTKHVKLTHGKAGFQKKKGSLVPAGSSKGENVVIMANAIDLLQKEHPEAIKTEHKIIAAELAKLGEEVWKQIRFRLVGAMNAPYLEPDKGLVADLAAVAKEAL